MSSDWKKSFFDETYIDFYSDLLTEEKTKNEVSFIESLFNQDIHTILDIPCGYGRHAKLFAEKGYHVVGVDVHDAQLRIAKEIVKKNLDLEYIKADLREYVGNNFDVVLNLFSSFGYFDRKTDIKVFENMVKSVKRNGLIVMDVRNPISLFNIFSQNKWHIEWSKNNIQGIEDFDPLSNKHTFRYIKDTVSKEGELNIYFPAEYEDLLNHFKCALKGMYGDYSGAVYDPLKSSRLIIVATKN